jgi:hypothetical protein
MQQDDDDEDDSDNLSISYISTDKRSSSQHQSKMYNIDEDSRISNDDGEEMILTASKLTPIILSTSMINTSRC